MRYKILLVGTLLVGSSALCAGEAEQKVDGDDEDLTEVDSLLDLRRHTLNDDGLRACIGYSTRNESEQYCEEEVPDDWQEFEFNGEKYYVQPLG